MKVLVFGSLNIDRTYRVSHLVQAGETLSAQSLSYFCGGKGFNQAIALKRAGMEVFFAGAVGNDGQMLLDALDQNGIDRSHVLCLEGNTGHAVIQVDDRGQNSIIILPGTNGQITADQMRAVLADFDPGDLLVAQNEISGIGELLRMAAQKGLRIAFNPAPCDERALACDLSCVDTLIINETEGAALSGQTESRLIMDRLHSRYPRLKILLTLGSSGSMFMDEEGRTDTCGIYPVQAVDTTAAGDTFIGYFLCAVSGGHPVREALRRAAVAAGISVSRKGAEPSIPLKAEVVEALKTCAVL